jgi:hypothetical protein
MICVNVLHHLTDYERFFTEAHRVGQADSTLLIVTDSREDILARGLARLFPESIELNLSRYPEIDDLVGYAHSAGFSGTDRSLAVGEIEIDERLLATIEQRGISELRLISDEAYAEGLQRVRKAQARGEKWLSQTTVLRFHAGPR